LSDSTRLKYLRIALVLVGIIFNFGIYPLMIAWPSGWTWHTLGAFQGSMPNSATLPGVNATFHKIWPSSLLYGMIDPAL
jgi:hypothetical protein